MKRNGSRTSCSNPPPRRGLACVTLAVLLGLSGLAVPGGSAGALALRDADVLQLAEARDDREPAASSKPSRPKIEETEAQRDLEKEKEALSEPLETTVKEGGILGGLLGGLSVGFGTGNSKKANVAVPTGVLLGSLAGKYVAAKQKKYSEEIAVIEAITKDVEDKNIHAQNAIVAMQTVVEEDRRRLAELRMALAEGEAEEDELEAMVEVAERDLETMQVATAKTEEHLETFVEARSIVLDDAKDAALAERDETRAMDAEIDALRDRIRAMHDLVAVLSDVS